MVGVLDGARVVIERMARIVAPAMVQDRAWKIPAIVSMMLTRFPSSKTGLEAKGQPPFHANRPVTGSKRHCNARSPSGSTNELIRILKVPN